MKIFPKGKGVWIYLVKDMMDKVDGYAAFADVASDLANHGFEHVIVKVANGYYPYNDDVDMVGFVNTLKSHGLQVFGFHYVYQPKLKSLLTRQANAGVKQVISLGLDGMVVNAEHQWHYGITAGTTSSISKNATHLAKEYRRLLPGMFLALSGYRFPMKNQPKYPCREFMAVFDANMPQVYWQGASNPVEQLMQAWDEHKIYAPGKPFIPTGFAFSEGGYTPKSQEIINFWKATQSAGWVANFYELRNSKLKQTQDFKIIWDVIAELGEEAPEPDPVSERNAILEEAKQASINSIDALKTR